ncbi:MAG: HAMP domain-containing protein [Anaerolineaceae bacterium]|nr:MAG: HAMP domain-containing protein [Anaerolineaceae bacterium]
MRKLYGLFQSLKLSQKFTVLIMAIIVLPLTILSILFFNNIQDSKIEEKMKNIEINFAQNYSQIQTKVEVCIMSTQAVVNSENFWTKISEYSKSEAGIKDLIDFNKTEIKGIEKLVNSNPYLYQIRVYHDIDEIPEMMPVLYHYDRMNRLSWAEDGEYTSKSWQLDYSDTIFPANLKPQDHLAAYITKFKINNDFSATIEVSTRMELLFPDMYSSNEDELTYFVDARGDIYFNTDNPRIHMSSVKTIHSSIPTDLDSFYSYRDIIDGVPVIIYYKPLKELGGNLIKVISIEKDIAEVNRTRRIFWISFIFIIVLLILFTDRIVDAILRHFYDVLKTIRRVQKGDMTVRVKNCGNDEIGELGQQVNEMLDRISGLMEDSIKREVLVKDSEIRALQNQINAHFIYNVLESIKMMAEVEEEYDISDAVTSLGKLLRYSMKWVSKNVTVAEEIEYIKNYLALINLRFDYEIYLSLNMPEVMYYQEIPKMSLQPIIENAIYHGIEDIAEDTNIYIKGNIHNGYCTIEITDAGRGMTDDEVRRLQKKIDGELETISCSGHGIGLKNVQDRIKISFGDDYGISIASKKNCYTKVVVKIPLLGVVS